MTHPSMTPRGTPYAVPVGSSEGDRPGTLPGSRGRLSGLVARAVGWVRDRPLPQLAAWVGAFGLALTAPFGGWADASHPPMTVVKVGDTVHTGPLDVTIERISATTRPGEKFAELTDGQWILVFGTVRSTTKDTLANGELRDAVRLSGVEGLEKAFFTETYLPADKALTAQPTMYAVQDSTMMSDLVPDLPLEVAWVWRQQAASAPGSIDVQVQGFTFRQRSLDDYEGWLDPEPVAHLRLPVTVKPGWVRPSPTAGASS